MWWPEEGEKFQNEYLITSNALNQIASPLLMEI